MKEMNDGKAMPSRIGSIGVAGMACEHQVCPLGIDQPHPMLSWKIEDGSSRSEVRDPRSEVRGQKQTAYQILVARSEKLLKKDKGDLWDSGMVKSDCSVGVQYVGAPLASGVTPVILWLYCTPETVSTI